MHQFGKVAVLMGGWSAEREVSLKSGQAVLRALLDEGVDAEAVDADRNVCEKLKSYDRVFNILHGRGGEDGEVQGLLDVMQIPYTGTGVLGSAVAMDKLLTKQIWTSMGLPTPEYTVLESEQNCEQAMKDLGLPLMIKPVLEGSSIGMSKVFEPVDMLPAWKTAMKSDCTVIAEKFIDGREYTAAILGEQVLPMILLETPRDFYDYQAKYDSDDTRYICPCGLDAEVEKLLASMVTRAFHSIHGRGWGRVDFMLDKHGQPWLIEVNTIPGMTDHSLVPMAAKQAGIDFNALVMEILRGTL